MLRLPEDFGPSAQVRRHQSQNYHYRTTQNTLQQNTVLQHQINSENLRKAGQIHGETDLEAAGTDQRGEKKTGGALRVHHADSNQQGRRGAEDLGALIPREV